MLTVKQLLTLILVPGCISGCATSCNPIPNPPVVIQDSGLPIFDAATDVEDSGDCVQPGPSDVCKAAGENLCQRKCLDSQGNPLWYSPTKHIPYAESCRRFIADNRDKTAKGTSRAQCLANLTDCSQVNGDCR